MKALLQLLHQSVAAVAPVNNIPDLNGLTSPRSSSSSMQALLQLLQQSVEAVAAEYS